MLPGIQRRRHSFNASGSVRRKGMKLFVGNVPPTATEQDIINYFSKYGIENVKTVRDQETGCNRPYCFAYLPDQCAQKAIEELHNTEFMGKMLVVTRSDHNARKNWSEPKNIWKYKHIAQTKR